MARRPSSWRLAMEALSRIDRKADAILAMKRVPRPIRELIQSIKDEDVQPTLRLNGRRR